MAISGCHVRPEPVQAALDMHGVARLRRTTLACLLGGLYVAGCATVEPKADYERMSRLIENATGYSVSIDPNEEEAVRSRVDEIVEDGLTIDEAVQLSLLNNPRLQAEFLNVGIGRADVVQSGLFSNPSLAFSFRFPDEGGLAEFEVSLAQNIAELWRIPHRTRSAEQELERIILSLARQAAGVAHDTRGAYLHVLQTSRQSELARNNLDIARQLVELAQARQKSGSGTEVDVNLARAERVALEVAVGAMAATESQARAELAKLIGLTVPPESLTLIDPLPEPVAVTFTVEQLIEVALSECCERKAAAATIDAAHARLSEERTRFLRTLEIGISSERSERRSGEGPSHENVVGPTFGIELPLFDQNQAAVVRAEYEWRKAVHLREAIDREITQDSYAGYYRARTVADTVALMQSDLLPLRERGLTLATEAYRVGSGTLITVVDAQRRLLEARSAYVDAQVDAALAAIELERIAGHPLGELTNAALNAPRQNEEKKP